MFSIEPYLAEFEESTLKDGALQSTWKPCRVVGITRDDDGEPAYIIEVVNRGTTYLRTVEYIRRKQ